MRCVHGLAGKKYFSYTITIFFVIQTNFENNSMIIFFSLIFLSDCCHMHWNGFVWRFSICPFIGDTHHEYLNVLSSWAKFHRITCHTMCSQSIEFVSFLFYNLFIHKLITRSMHIFVYKSIQLVWNVLHSLLSLLVVFYTVVYEDNVIHRKQTTKFPSYQNTMITNTTMFNARPSQFNIQQKSKQYL